jgi:hypothetical protein
MSVNKDLIRLLGELQMCSKPQLDAIPQNDVEEIGRKPKRDHVSITVKVIEVVTDKDNNQTNRELGNNELVLDIKDSLSCLIERHIVPLSSLTEIYSPDGHVKSELTIRNHNKGLFWMSSFRENAPTLIDRWGRELFYEDKMDSAALIVFYESN